ncbi:DUF397 domain-containing protein [Streptomyces radicis]|uniref:DUF397 domain-containing protein n=1 Tax=Streptomyces radicis TaxID=1750517 RepID=A0A3A9WCK1_9ACTN|nr:DUF397 domain-containing protein [Streptomyces radicis]RKN15133.1 DUF397 domain-containing protein [Streptomyces radicis]
MASELADAADWYKSSYSTGSGNNCVETADLTHTDHRAVAVRDSKRANGPALLVSPTSWAYFIDGLPGR